MRLIIFKILLFGYGFSLEWAKSESKKNLPKFKLDWMFEEYSDYMVRLRVFYIVRIIVRLHLNRC